MFSKVAPDRLVNLNPVESRLIVNTKRAYDDFAREFVAGDHASALRTLLNGFNAAAILFQSLLDEGVTRTNDKEKYMNLIEAETPSNSPVVLLDRRKGKTRSFDFPEIIYAIRCAMVHSYEDLDIAQSGVDSEVRLDWNLRSYFNRQDWTMPALHYPNDCIVFNAYDVIDKVSSVLNKMIFWIESAQKYHQIEEALKSKKPTTNRTGPTTLAVFKSSHPHFHELLEKAGILKRRNVTSDEFSALFAKRSQVGQVDPP